MNYTKDGIILRKLEQIKEQIYQNAESLPEWESWEGTYDAPGEYTIAAGKSRTIRVGESWVCRDHLIRWFKRKVEIPQSVQGKKVVLLLNFGGEGIVRVDGEIRSSVTSYLEENAAQRICVNLTDAAKPGRSFIVEIEAGMNYMEFAPFRNRGATEIHYTICQAQLAVLDEVVEQCYFDFYTTFLALQTLRAPSHHPNTAACLPNKMDVLVERSEKDEYTAQKIEAALCRAMSLVEFDFTPEQLRNSLVPASESLKKSLAEIPHMPHHEITFVGQGHIDTAWRWTIRESIRKTAKTFSNSFDLMKRDPEYIFAFSQPQLFEFVKKYYPELYEEAKREVQKGQLELVGNTWVEMDANIPSGESLVRQLLYGTEFFEREFGKSSSVFWMPDVFGYTWALPQIIKKSGMRYFFTSKLCNNDTNRFPYTLFNWKGIDGTTVLSYVQRLNYNGTYEPKTVDTIYKSFDEKARCDYLMMTYGYGDGGGGPNREMLEMGHRLQSFPGLQRTRFGSSASFFEKAEKTQSELPVWSDEMYFEHHRGTYTSQADVKKANRKNELLYRSAELRAACSYVATGQAYPAEELLKGYKVLLTNQFHDILPGSSIHAVYEQARDDYKEVQGIGLAVQQEADHALLTLLEHQRGDLAVFNDLAWPRSEIVMVKGATSNTCVIDCRTNEPVVCEYSNGAISFLAADVPALGICCFRLEEGTALSAGKRLALDERHMENEFLQICFDENGNILSIYDKENARNVLAEDEHPASLKIFEDKPANETAWNVDLEYQNKYWRLEPISAELVENTSLRSVLNVKYKFNRSTIQQKIILSKGSRRIDFCMAIDWQEREKMLKAEYFADVFSNKASYEIQFGAIERPNHWNQSQDKARFEVCGHKWADLSEGDYGLSLLNDCKYGYDIKDNRMRLTLLRSSIDPDPSADIGFHNFTYALYPHQHDWRLGKTVNEGFALNVPLRTVCCETDVPQGEKSVFFFESTAANVILDTIKCAEDGEGLILRFYEAIGNKTSVRLRSGVMIQAVEECDLMERKEKKWTHDGNGFEFTIKPYEIKTFRVKVI